VHSNPMALVIFSKQSDNGRTAAIYKGSAQPAGPLILAGVRRREAYRLGRLFKSSSRGRASGFSKECIDRMPTSGFACNPESEYGRSFACSTSLEWVRLPSICRAIGLRSIKWLLSRCFLAAQCQKSTTSRNGGQSARWRSRGQVAWALFESATRARNCES
jgi:hypothetical protein